MTIKRILASLLSLTLTLSLLTGCAKEGSAPLRMDIGGGVANLDPQFATDGAGCTIIANCFEGLLQKDSEGNIVAGAAESYKVSSDGLTYTFFLRSDAKWNDGETVTAEDFAFALGRLFHPQVPSPYAEEFLMIKNAPAVLSGELPQTMLGVTAKDSATLEITLSEPSPLFTDRLTSTAAMPCNEKFFTETRARYGLEEGYLKFNGAYRVSHWDNSKYIEMSPNKHYHTRGELPFPEVYLYTNRRTETKTTLDLFNEGKSDIYMATAEELARITVKDTSCMEIKNKVWQLIFSTEYGELSNEEIRRSLVLSLDSSGYRERIPEMYGLASSIIPESARPKGLMLPTLPGLHRDEAQSLMALGLSELDKKSLKPLSILIPKDAQLNTVAGYLQKQWKDTLGLYVNLEAVATKDFWARLQKGDFSLAILPLEASGQDCSQLLTAFMSTDSRNYGGFASEEYDRLLENAIKASTGEEALEYYHKAEQLLLDRGATVPLFTQSGYYAFSKGTTGVESVTGLLRFKNAARR